MPSLNTLLHDSPSSAELELELRELRRRQEEDLREMADVHREMEAGIEKLLGTEKRPIRKDCKKI